MNKDIFLPTVAEFLSMTTQGSQSIGETRQRKQTPTIFITLPRQGLAMCLARKVGPSTCTSRLPVTLRTTRFNIKKFCMVIILYLYVLYGWQKNE